eukprot:363740-Chlamydomonas_euryale.AAC.1
MERMERVIVKDFKREDIKTYVDKLQQNHRVRKRLDTMHEAARKLVRSFVRTPPLPPASMRCCTVRNRH